VGRTGRAGKTGIAVTFVDWDDLHKWALINKALEMGIPEPVETYSSSPHFLTDLDIPAGTKGRLKTTPIPQKEKRAGEPPRTKTTPAKKPQAHDPSDMGDQRGRARTRQRRRTTS
jgi:superfamily II DNA/RNA helicase